MSNLKGFVNKGEMGKISKKLKRKFETMKGYEGDERMMFEFILRRFAKSEIWDKIKEPLSLKLNADEYPICCENTTHMMNTLKEARMPGYLAARLRCAETKVATWDDLAFKLIILGWNVKHRNFAKR
nr:hypothetical protein [Tanacetum cinerariifolium]